MSKKVGTDAEDLACKYLLGLGYQILTRNFYSRFGEIDIIAKKSNVIHFFEVKYSKKCNPLERITPAKLSKIIKTVDFYMYTKNCYNEYQVDALLVQDSDIEILENISQLQ